MVLDHLTDPHNVGAIIRTAECGGADAVILPDRRSAGINATVRKAAAGAAAHLPIARVANFAQAIRTLKKAGIWVAGADAGPGAVPMGQADLDRDLAIVIGAEGTGLAPLDRRECDYLVAIPDAGENRLARTPRSRPRCCFTRRLRQRAAASSLTLEDALLYLTGCAALDGLRPAFAAHRTKRAYKRLWQ